MIAQGIDHAPWLPCSRCASMPVDCRCDPVPLAEWESQLRRSRNDRAKQAEAAKLAALTAYWAAA